MTPSAAPFGGISICIPTYNGAMHLADALLSATAQTHSPHEILVVDDGSTDATQAIATRVAAIDDRVRVVRNPDRLGLVGNWNRCVQLASGEWIKFLFQDDLLAPGCLAELSRGMGSTDAVIGFVGRGLIMESGDRRERAMAREIRRAHIGRSVREPQLLTPRRVSDLVIGAPTRNVFGEPTAAMFRRDLIEHHGPFDAALRQLCDWEFWIRVATQHGVWFEPTELATFRLHSQSVSSQNQERNFHPFDPHLLDAIRLKEKLLHDDEFAPFRHFAPAGDLRSIERQLQRHLHRLELSSPHHHRQDPAGSSSTSPSVPPATRAQRFVERLRWIGGAPARRILR